MEKHLHLIGDCDVCRKEVEVNLVKVKSEFKIRDLNIEAEITIPHCMHCNEVVTIQEIEDENSQILYEKYKELKGLLSAIEIINIRQKFNLSASDFAIILGFGEKTITRYENGSIQEFSHDNLIRHATQPHVLADLYQRQKHNLSLKNRVSFTNTMLKYGILVDHDTDVLQHIEASLLPQSLTVDYHPNYAYNFAISFVKPRRKSKCNTTAI